MLAIIAGAARFATLGCAWNHRTCLDATNDGAGTNVGPFTELGTEFTERRTTPGVRSLRPMNER